MSPPRTAVPKPAAPRANCVGGRRVQRPAARGASCGGVGRAAAAGAAVVEPVRPTMLPAASSNVAEQVSRRFMRVFPPRCDGSMGAPETCGPPRVASPYPPVNDANLLLSHLLLNPSVDNVQTAAYVGVQPIGCGRGVRVAD